MIKKKTNSFSYRGASSKSSARGMSCWKHPIGFRPSKILTRFVFWVEACFEYQTKNVTGCCGKIRRKLNLEFAKRKLLKLVKGSSLYVLQSHTALAVSASSLTPAGA